jgi:hypothetical protein
MSDRSARSAGPTSSRRRRVPVGTWIGIGSTALLSLIGLLSGGVWSMIMMASLVVLPTVAYGALFRRTTWLRLPRRRSMASIGVAVALTTLVVSTSAYGATHPEPAAPVEHAAAVAQTHRAAPAGASQTATPTAPPTPTPTPVVLTKTETHTEPVAFTATTVESATLAQGTTSVTTVGVDGVRTKTYTVTYTDGVETSRVLTGNTVTTAPVAQVTTVGTFVAPPPAPAPASTCLNGTYINSAGASVCRPEASSTVPTGATARCGDGTYSFSQSRRGTCSSHGGVAAWL